MSIISLNQKLFLKEWLGKVLENYRRKERKTIGGDMILD
jgi:hypothetical protein